MKRLSKPAVILPELTFDHLDSVMNERIQATKNSNTVIPMLWQGFLELQLPVKGGIRTAKLYIPKDTPQGTVFVLMNVPEGEITEAFLEKSGWRQKADAEGFCLFLLEPGPEGWGTPDEEQPYIQAGFQAEIQGKYCLPAFATYVVGYGIIGVAIHKAVMANPLCVAAAVFLDASDVESSYLEEYRNKEFRSQTVLGAEQIRNYNTLYRDIPVPVWIAGQNIGKRTRDMADYWKKASRTGEMPVESLYGKEYIQAEPTAFTPEGNILKVCVREAKYDYSSPSTTETVYHFLRQFYRYGMGPCSNIITQKVDYRSGAVQHRRFTDGNGINREYLVYIPEAYRNKKRKLPLVLAFHGASQSMRNMFENGLWYRIADREGLIIVCPESTLVPLSDFLHGGIATAYRPLWQLENPDMRHTDAEYVNELLDRVIAEFPVDESRMYCTGHSMGCMMTNYLGSSHLSHRFAAMGATCGILNGREDTGEEPIPVFLTMGEYDLWSYHISESSTLTAALDMWLIRNGLATAETVETIRKTGASEIWQEGRMHNTVWKDETGIPWLRYAWVEKRDHMHSPEENEILWRQWFSKWRRGEDGTRIYTGDTSEKE